MSYKYTGSNEPSQAGLTQKIFNSTVWEYIRDSALSTSGLATLIDDLKGIKIYTKECINNCHQSHYNDQQSIIFSSTPIPQKTKTASYRNKEILENHQENEKTQIKTILKTYRSGGNFTKQTTKKE